MKRMYSRNKTSSNNSTRLTPVHQDPTVRGREVIAFHWEELCWVTSGWMRHWDFFFKDLYEAGDGG